MLIVLILLIAAVLIFLKIKKDKAEEARFEQEKARREQEIAERKKDGEPKICTKMPLLEGKGKTVTGPDGKSYPKAVLEKNYSGVIYNFFQEDAEDVLHKKYETSPLFCMAAMEYYVNTYYYGGFDYLKPEVFTKKYVEEGIYCIHEVAENYAYSALQDNDLIQAEHYLVRRMADRKRAMEGNGYYKNVYDIPVNMDKALIFYGEPDRLREKYTNYLSVIGTDCTITMVKCWLQTAHIYSAQGDAQKAKKLYSQVYQMAVHFSLDDLIMELMHALTSGYPRNPADYQDHAFNILADWACRSDLGLAAFVEYVLYVNGLDKSRMAKNPEEAFKLYEEQAENNHYAAYLLGLATLSGYGAAKDEAKGRRIIEIAAKDGCISALFLLIRLSAENKEEANTWQADLDKAVSVIAAESGAVRTELEQNGKSVTKQRFAEIKRDLAEAERKQRTGYEKASRQMEKTAAETQTGFTFPRFIYDGNENPWELMNSGYDNATYYCQKTGETETFYKSDFEFGVPSGFHLR